MEATVSARFTNSTSSRPDTQTLIRDWGFGLATAHPLDPNVITSIDNAATLIYLIPPALQAKAGLKTGHEDGIFF
jgi:hypothetical protein